MFNWFKGKTYIEILLKKPTSSSDTHQTKYILPF
jgi:hypothetical protein